MVGVIVFVFLGESQVQSICKAIDKIVTRRQQLIGHKYICYVAICINEIRTSGQKFIHVQFVITKRQRNNIPMSCKLFSYKRLREFSFSFKGFDDNWSSKLYVQTDREVRCCQIRPLGIGWFQQIDPCRLQKWV